MAVTISRERIEAVMAAVLTRLAADGRARSARDLGDAGVIASQPTIRKACEELVRAGLAAATTETRPRKRWLPTSAGTFATGRYPTRVYSAVKRGEDSSDG